MSEPENHADAVWRRDEPQSPCVKLCVVDPATRACLGCGRTPDEIAAWRTMSADDRRALLALLPARLAAAVPKRGDTRRKRRRPAADGAQGAD